MLETELKKLNANLEKLITAIESVGTMRDAVYELNATLETQEVGSMSADTPSKKSVSEIVDEHSKKLKEEKAESRPEPEPEPEPEREAETEHEVHTVESIRSIALAISRKDRSKQKDIKAKLAEHNAKLATDLKGNDVTAVGNWLSSLKEEIGA